MTRDDNRYRAWRRRKAPRPRFRPNDRYMHEYEEAIILADCQRLERFNGPGAISAKALRRQEPGRYSVKLAIVLHRMAKRGGPLKPTGARRLWGQLMPTYELQSQTKERAA